MVSTATTLIYAMTTICLQWPPSTFAVYSLLSIQQLEPSGKYRQTQPFICPEFSGGKTESLDYRRRTWPERVLTWDPLSHHLLPLLCAPFANSSNTPGTLNYPYACSRFSPGQRLTFSLYHWFIFWQYCMLFVYEFIFYLSP
jgi:hypothetical protein